MWIGKSGGFGVCPLHAQVLEQRFLPVYAVVGTTKGLRSMPKYVQPQETWMTNPEQALLEIERRLDDEGRYYGATGQFKALSQLPRNLAKLRDDVLLLDHTEIADVSGLSAVPQIKRLSLPASVSDVSVLPHLPNLEDLHIDKEGTSLIDYRPLGQCKSLRRLRLNASAIDDMSFLENSGIEELTLIGFRGKRLPMLPGLRRLDVWHAGDAHFPLDLSSIAASQSIESIKSLRASYNLPDRLPDLSSLTIDLNDAGEVATIGNYVALKTLSIRCPELTDVTPLLSCTGLEELTIRGTALSDVGCLTELPRLTSINLPETKVTDIAKLSYVTSLQAISVSKTPIASLEGWNPSADLSRLDLSHTHIHDISPLFGSRIANLHLNQSKVLDLTGISNIRGLHRLSIGGTDVAEVPETERHLDLFKKPAYQDPREGRVFSFANTPLAESGFRLLE